MDVVVPHCRYAAKKTPNEHLKPQPDTWREKKTLRARGSRSAPLAAVGSTSGIPRR